MQTSHLTHAAVVLEKLQSLRVNIETASHVQASLASFNNPSVCHPTAGHYRIYSRNSRTFSILCLTTHLIHQGHEKRKEIRDVSTFTTQHVRAALSVMHMAQKIVSRQKHNMLSLLHAACLKLLVLFLNQNFVSKFRVRDLCEQTILRRFIMKLKCDNQ